MNVTTWVSSNRTGLGLSSSIQLEAFVVNKLKANTYLLVEGDVAGFGAYSGSMQQGWRYAGCPEAIAQNLVYTGYSHSIVVPTRAMIANCTTTGPNTMFFRYFAINGDNSNRPFNVYNPNGSDDVRLGQTQSIYTVWEIDPNG